MVVRPDRRLAFLAIAKFAAISGVWGLVIAVGFSFDPQVAFPATEAVLIPPMLAVMGGGTLGAVLALVWWACAGQVTYTVAEGFLTVRRGRWIREQIPVERIADVGFDRRIRWTHLVFTEWFGHTSAIPVLSVTLTRTSNRWDPTNEAVVEMPRILLSGERQSAALAELRRALGLDVRSPSAPRG